MQWHADHATETYFLRAQKRPDATKEDDDDSYNTIYCPFKATLTCIPLFYPSKVGHIGRNSILCTPIHRTDGVLPAKCVSGCVALAIRPTCLLYRILTTKQHIVLNDVISVSVGGDINHLTSLAMSDKADTILKGVHTATVRYLVNCLIAAVAQELGMQIPDQVAYVADQLRPTSFTTDRPPTITTTTSTTTTTTTITPTNVPDYMQQARAFGLDLLTKPMREISSGSTCSLPLLGMPALPTHAYKQLKKYYGLHTNT